MRTYVALSNESVAAAHAGTSGSQEVWGYWPDDEPLKGLHPGDTRAALTPFLAHEVGLSHVNSLALQNDTARIQHSSASGGGMLRAASESRC